MKKSFLSLFLLLCAFIMQPQQCLAQIYNIGSNINVSNISTDGTYVVAYTQNQGTRLWTLEEGLVAIDGAEEASRSYAVSNNRILVGQCLDERYPYYSTFLSTAAYFKDGKWVKYGILESVEDPTKSNESRANTISSDGTIIGGQSYTSSTDMEAVYWIDDEMFILDREGCDDAALSTMSGNGEVFGGWVYKEATRYPAIWKGEEKEKLEILYEGVALQGEVLKISENGKYAAMELMTINGIRPALYNIETDEITLIELLPGAFYGSAHGISNDGIVVGYNSMGGWDPETAFIYSERIGLYSISDYLITLGIDFPEGMLLTRGEALSADGLRIVGNGDVNWVPTGWVVDIEKHKDGFNPPRALSAQEKEIGKILLSWSAPNPEIGFTLKGYNIYRDEQKVNTQIIENNFYEDMDLSNGTYHYQVSAIWRDNENPETSEESTLSLPIKINTALLSIPFKDDFSSKNFDTSFWNTGKVESNWIISLSSGIIAPCATFIIPNFEYSEGLTSPYIDARNASEVYLSFSLAPAKKISEDGHKLSIEVFDGEEWNTVKKINPLDEEVLFSHEKIDISGLAANKQIKVRFTASGPGENAYLAWNIDNIRVYDNNSELIAEIPLNVNAVKKTDGSVSISWTDPNETANLAYAIVDEWADVVGNEGKSVIFANMFDKEDLTAFDGYEMTSITAFCPTFSPDDPARYKLVAFDDENQLLSQDVYSYKSSEFNTFEINEPVIIDASKPLYYGIEVVYHAALDMPIGLSSIEEVNGKSNLYSEDGGQTWHSLKDDFNISRSLAIRASVAKTPETEPKEGLLGYAIYRDGNPLLEDGAVNPLNIFTDLNAPDEACYQIAAYYYMTQQYSELTEPECLENVDIKNPDLESNRVHIFPNPTESILFLSEDVKSISVSDMSGKKVMQNNVSGSEINLNNLPDGIYLVEIETYLGNTEVHKIIKQKK